MNLPKILHTARINTNGRGRPHSRLTCLPTQPGALEQTNHLLLEADRGQQDQRGREEEVRQVPRPGLERWLLILLGRREHSLEQ